MLVCRKKKEMGDVDSDGNPVELTDDEKEGDGQLGDESVDAGRVETAEDVPQEVKEELREVEQNSPERKPRTRPGGKAATAKPADGEEKAETNGVDASATPTPKRRGRKPAVKQEDGE